MSFATPLYFLALIGLAIPLIIHMWNRKSAKTIMMGSIQFLETSTTTNSFKFIISDWPLLLLRILLITFLTLLLTKPVWKSSQTMSKIFIDPTLLDVPQVKQLLDTTRSEVRLFSSGFPEIENNKAINESEITDYWALVNQIQHLDSATIVVTSRMANYSGIRPKTQIPINWITIDAARSEFRDSIYSYAGIENSYEIVQISDAGSTRFEKVKVDGKPGLTDTLQITIASNSEFQQEAEYIESALDAIRKYLDMAISITMVSDEEDVVGADWLFWFSENPIDNPIPTIVFQRTAFSPEIQPAVTPNLFYLKGKISATGNLPEVILNTLKLWDQGNLNSEIAQSDYRTITLEGAPETVAAKTSGIRLSTLNSLWWGALILLIVAERIISHRKVT